MKDRRNLKETDVAMNEKEERGRRVSSGEVSLESDIHLTLLRVGQSCDLTLRTSVSRIYRIAIGVPSVP